MAFCGKCGNPLQENAQFCPNCGAAVASAQGHANMNPDAPVSENDVKENKPLAILAYIGPLALIPYLGWKNSPFAQFHAKQGMNLLLVWVGYAIVALLLGLIRVQTYVHVFGFPVPVMGSPWWVILINWVLGLGIAALAVLGILNAVKGETKPLPIVGKWKIFK